MSSRKDRLERIVAELVLTGVIPQSTVYGARVRCIAIGTLGVTKSTSDSYASALEDAYKTHRWILFVKENPYLNKEQKENWIGLFSSKK